MEHHLAQTYLNKYPEISQLQNATGSAENNINYSLAAAILKQPQEELLEIDRTLSALINLHYLYQHSPEFIARQKISHKYFDQLYQWIKITIDSEEKYRALEVFLAINDLGKSKKFIDFAQKHHLTSLNYDEVLLFVLKNFPQEVPSFNQLGSDCKTLIINSLSTNFNFGQFVQSENYANSLVDFLKLSQEQKNFILIESLLDISGAGGDQPILTDKLLSDFFLAVETVENFTDPLKAYNHYLIKKIQCLELPTRNHTEIQIFSKLMALTRSNSQSELNAIYNAFEKLTFREKKVLIIQLSKTGFDDGATVIYYLPALLANAKKYYQQKYQDKFIFELSLETTLKIMTKIYLAAYKVKKREDFFTVYARDIAMKCLEDPNQVLNSELIVDLQTGHLAIKDPKKTCKQ